MGLLGQDCALSAPGKRDAAALAANTLRRFNLLMLCYSYAE
jgi:hypothetical protein